MKKFDRAAAIKNMEDFINESSRPENISKILTEIQMEMAEIQRQHFELGKRYNILDNKFGHLLHMREENGKEAEIQIEENCEDC